MHSSAHSGGDTRASTLPLNRMSRRRRRPQAASRARDCALLYIHTSTVVFHNATAPQTNTHCKCECLVLMCRTAYAGGHRKHRAQTLARAATVLCVCVDVCLYELLCCSVLVWRPNTVACFVRTLARFWVARVAVAVAVCFYRRPR